MFSVSGGIFSSSFVGIGDVGQIRNLISEDFFVGGIDLIVMGLSIVILLFKRVQKVKSRLYGINGSHFHVNEVGEYGLSVSLLTSTGNS